MEKNCPCPSKKEDQKAALPILGGILIAILPKCPFCILAYSSAMTLCNGSKIYHHAPGWASWISIVLAMLTLAMVLLNYRGTRTLIATALILIGSLLIIRSELYTGDVQGYYIGATALILGVWINASFLYVFHKWIKPFSNELITKSKNFIK